MFSHFVPPSSQIMGLYILLADDDEEGFESNSASWTPQLYDWQQAGSNVLFFTFIHPDTMDIPPAFAKLAATRGTDQPGAVPADTVILFAIGTYSTYETSSTIILSSVSVDRSIFNHVPYGTPPYSVI